MSEEKKYLEVPQDEEVQVPPKAYGLGIRHLQMLSMMVCMMALFISRSCMAVAILAMTDKNRLNDTNVQIYEWDKKTQGVVLSSFFWGYMVMQIPAGALSRRWGGKLMLEAALVVSGAVCLVTPLFAHFGGWYLVCACRVVMGVSQACTFSASHTLLGKWLPASERTSYIGLVYGGAAMGTVVGLPLSGFLSATVLGWKMIFYSMAGLCFAIAAMWHCLAASSPGEHPWMKLEEKQFIEQGLNISDNTKQVHRTPWRQILTSRGMLAIMSAHVGSVFIFILMFSDLPTYLERGLHISLTNSASLSALPYIGMWAGGIVSGLLSQKILNKKWLSLNFTRKLFNSIALFGAAGSLVLLSFLGAESQHWAVAALVATLFFQSFCGAGFMANYLDISPNFGGVMLSVTNFFSNMGSVVTPIITSFILRNDPTDLSRWRVVFLLFAALTAALNVLYVLLGTTARAPWDDPGYCHRLDQRKASILTTEKPEKQNKTSV